MLAEGDEHLVVPRAQRDKEADLTCPAGSGLTPMPAISFTVDLKGLSRFQNSLSRDLRNRENGPIREAINEWGVIYRRWLRARYSRYSRGGGSWPPLKPGTIKRKGHARILRDTDTMFEALDPQFQAKPGQLNQHIPFGIRTGYGSSAMHPTAKVPTDKLAYWHQVGAGYLPARPIIVPPSGVVVREMADVMRKAVRKATRLARVE